MSGEPKILEVRAYATQFGSIGEISGLPVRPSSRLKPKIVLDRKKPVKQMIGLAPL
jgi:hypothetical protein